MCVCVRTTATTIPRFHRADVAIDLPAGLTHGQSFLLVRAILEGMGIDQPDLGAVCWCGEQVQVRAEMPCSTLSPLIPRQDSSLVVEMRHGA